MFMIDNRPRFFISISTILLIAILFLTLSLNTALHPRSVKAAPSVHTISNSFAEAETAAARSAKGVSVYIGGSNSLYALNASNGSPRWSFQADGTVYSPALVNGVVYIGGQSVYAINATNGSLRW